MDNYQITSYSGAEIEALLDKIDDLGNASQSTAGLMSAADKTKLDGLDSGAQANVLEGVKIDGADLPIAEKKVNIPVDSSPTSGSNSLVRSGGVFNAIKDFITNSVNDLVYYYTKSETYTKTEVNNIIGSLQQFHYEIYASTSAVTNPQSNVLYLIGPTGTGSDKYEEYVYSNGWVKIGDTTIDLSGYSTTEQMNAAINNALQDYATKEEVSQLGQEVKDTYGDYVENSEWLKVELDNEGGIIEGYRTDGTKEINLPVEFKKDVDIKGNIVNQGLQNTLNSKANVSDVERDLGAKVNKIDPVTNVDNEETLSYFESSENSEWAEVTIDEDGRIAEGIKRDGTKFIGDFPLKTINNQSIVGEGNIEIENDPQVQSDWNQTDNSSPAFIKNKPDLSEKQDTLISSQNIKTINNISLLGSGNISISGGGSTSDSNFIDACNYGFSTENSAADNVSALQTVLDGGNRTVFITIPGIYLLNDTILLYDNTTLICEKGVILKKASAYSHMFLNEGAAERRTNSNIALIGLNIDVNGMQSTPGMNSALYGMRGQISFLCSDRILVQDFTCTTLGNSQYGIQFNTFHNINIRNVIIEGEKDGIHLSDGDMFRISDCILNTSDDPIALNSSDWQSSNCVDGSITNGIIENIQTDAYNETSGHFRLLVGAWVDWYSGMSIRRGDRVVSEGRVYRACTDSADGSTYTSETKPTITTYSGTQNDSGGFYWKLMKVGTVYQTNINNIVYKNCICSGNKNYFFCEVDKISDWNRSLYPDVIVGNYPHIENIKVENCKMMGSGGSFNSTPDANTTIVFNECIVNISPNLKQPSDSALLAEYHFDNIDFRNRGNNEAVRCFADTVVYINNCVGNGGIVRIGGDWSGRIISNSNIDKTPLGAIKGDHCIVNQTPKIYNGNDWTELI